MICPIISSGKDIVKCKTSECMAWKEECKKYGDGAEKLGDCPDICIGKEDIRFCQGYCKLIESFPSPEDNSAKEFLSRPGYDKVHHPVT